VNATDRSIRESAILSSPAADQPGSIQACQIVPGQREPIYRQASRADLCLFLGEMAGRIDG